MWANLVKFMLRQSIWAINDGNSQLVSECINCYWQAWYAQSYGYEKNWEPQIGLVVIKNEWSRIQQVLRSYKNGFAFNVNDLGSLKGHEICIELTNDMPIFWKHYKYNDLEKSLIQSKTQELWEVGLVELFVREYASTTMMLTKTNSFCN
jgi:hypothetical protein